MLAYIDRYFRSLKHNPKEEKRFQRDTVKYEKLKAAGKMAPSVVPKNLIDGEAARQNLQRTVTGLIAHFEEQLREGSELDADAQAVTMIDYLKERSSEYAYKLSDSMARHRAIELMKEVGIPEPAKRFHQYPFEFSGGMRQRIVIAIALSANPDILICDEPTTALDVTIQAQILELINRLKKERNLSVIFITHDLGVVANMADRIAIMYAGKIVEFGTADDVFYDPRHPYTWALLSSMPDLETKEKLEAIPGTPPNMILPPKGDAFAARNRYAMQIDFEEQPPMFEVSPTHTAATWLMHPNAPKVEPPAIVRERIERMQKRNDEATKEGGEAS
ncbi:MAG: ABC transporter ATP-binding protein [Christensenellaceae bacterium]|nr:ABC transporter ATP-binding protein [Christensenellaceae bacterium]